VKEYETTFWSTKCLVFREGREKLHHFSVCSFVSEDKVSNMTLRLNCEATVCGKLA